MRGEKCASARVFLQMLDDSPGDAESVERRSAAADFVEQDQARRRGVIEDAGDFAHFDEERRTAAREIVGGADAREDAVDDREFCLPRGDEAAGLRHQRDQCGLAQVGGLAAHVRAGDQQKLLRLLIEVEIVGNEALAALAQQFFDDRMSTADDEQFTGRR